MKRVVSLLFFLSLTLSVAAQSAKVSTVAMVYRNAAGASLPYRQYVTPDVVAGTKLPLVIFLHGAGERGTDNEKQLIHGIQSILDYSRQKKMPLALIAPQCPVGKQWVDTPWALYQHRMPAKPSVSMQLAFELLDERCKALSIDPKRIYVTGVSMGGYGTWDMIQRRPAFFAAALPVCGGGDVTLAWKIRDVPIWTFHGDRDGAVPVFRSRSMVSALWLCEGNIRYREYPGAGHNVWTPTYKDSTVLDWFFSQKK